MRSTLLIGFIALTAGCATIGTPTEDRPGEGRWQGYVLRNGLRSPITVELSQVGDQWDGRLSTGDNAVPLDHVRMTATSVHFELPGDGVFDGAIAGDEMAGAISGGANGSFQLSRDVGASRGYSPYFLGP